MAMTRTLWSINGLSTELGRDRRTIAKALSSVHPDGQLAGERAWFLSTALHALDRSRAGAPPKAENPLIEMMLGRLENWREIRGRGHCRSFTPAQIAGAFGYEVGDVLTWLRAGMPYEVEGDWATGEGFGLQVRQAVELVALVS